MLCHFYITSKMSSILHQINFEVTSTVHRLLFGNAENEKSPALMNIKVTSSRNVQNVKNMPVSLNC